MYWKNRCRQKANKKYKGYIILKWNEDKKRIMVSSCREGKFNKFILQILNKLDHIENKKIFKNFYIDFNKNFIYNLNIENYMILKWWKIHENFPKIYKNYEFFI